TATWAQRLPPTAVIEVGRLSFYLLHNVAELNLDPPTPSRVAIKGWCEWPYTTAAKPAVLYLNPGSAGPRRFRLPATIAQVAGAVTELTPKIIALIVQPDRPDKLPLEG